MGCFLVFERRLHEVRATTPPHASKPMASLQPLQREKTGGPWLCPRTEMMDFLESLDDECLTIGGLGQTRSVWQLPFGDRQCG